MKLKTLKTLVVLLIALISFNSCSTFLQKSESDSRPAYVAKNVIQFAKAKKPAKPGDLNSFALTDPKYGSIVCFPPDKAKLLRLYIDQLEQSIDEANVTIDNANDYINKLNK